MEKRKLGIHSLMIQKTILKNKIKYIYIMSGMAFANLFFFHSTLEYCHKRLKDLEEDIQRFKKKIKYEELNY
jgi:hypothetical protein